MDKKINIIQDEHGRKTVVIDDVIFNSRRNIPWREVERYLKRYVGDIYEVLETGDCIYIGTDLPNEYVGSKYTARLKGAYGKAKANAVQGIPEIIAYATGKRYKENLDPKHSNDDKYGWYRYNIRFAIPIYEEERETNKHNIFSAEILVRHARSGKKYLYDMINIKKIK